MPVQDERTVYLFPDDAERLPGLESEQCEQSIQQTFERQPGFVPVSGGRELTEFFLQLCERSGELMGCLLLMLLRSIAR